MHRFPRTLAAAVVLVAFTTTACQGANPTGAPTLTATNPAFAGKKTGTIKGTVTPDGVLAAAFRIFQAGGIPNATVTCVSGGVATEVKTDAQGNFAVQALQGMDAVITATHSDTNGNVFREVTTVKVPTAAEPPIVDVASLVTRRTGSIQGLIELPGGQSAEGADVFIGGTTMVGKASAKGRFALANVPEGIWDVVVQKPGYGRTVISEVAVEAGKPVVLTEPVALEPAAAGPGVTGAIRDGAGKAVVGASVTLYAADGASVTATSDEQGKVAINDLPAGEYQVQVYRAFYQPYAGQTMTVTEGESADLGEIALQSTTVYFGKASGQVLDEAGDPVDGAVVMLDPPVTEHIFTDAQGRFTLDRIMPGDYTLHVAAGGLEVYSRELRLDNAPNAVVTFDEPLLMRQAPLDLLAAFRIAAAPKRMTELMAPAPILTGMTDDNLPALYWDEPEASRWPDGFTAVTYEVQHLDDASNSPNRSSEVDGDWETVDAAAQSGYEIEDDAWLNDEFRVRAVGKHQDGEEYVSDWQTISLKSASFTGAAGYSVLAKRKAKPLDKFRAKRAAKLKAKIDKLRAELKPRKSNVSRGQRQDKSGKVSKKGYPKKSRAQVKAHNQLRRAVNTYRNVTSKLGK